MHHFHFPATDPVLIVALVMGVVLVAPLLAGRLRLPGLVGLLVAGVVVGPNGLDLLVREGTVEVLGTIGLLYIMFLAGLEVDLHEFARHRRPSVIFGGLAFALPLVLGAAMGVFALDFSWPQAILLGSLFASHTLIAYPIARRLGLANARPVTTTVGATILTDTLALLVLAVVAGGARGGVGPLFWAQLAGSLAVYTAAVAWGLPRLGRWFFRTVRAGEVAEFVFVLAAVFACGFLAEVAGVEAIIGAFLAGLALNRLVPHASPLMARLAFVGDALFIPFFLLSVGMLVDLRVLAADAQAWVVIGAMLVTTLGTKVLAVWAMKPIAGYSPQETVLMYGLSISQAAAALATALVGYEVGLFDDAVLNGTIVIMMVTCVLGPLITERAGRRVAVETARAEAAAPAERPERILVPLANPESAGALMDLALALRDPRGEEPLFPLAVAAAGPDEARAVAAGERVLAHAVVHATAADVAVHPLTRVDPNVAEGIGRAVRERRISTVVVGWNGAPSAQARVFGSVLDQFLDESGALVLVSRLAQPLATTRRVVVLVPPYAEREAGFPDAARAVKGLAARLGASFHVVAAADALPGLEAALADIPPALPIATTPLDGWAGLVPALDAALKPDDLVVLLSVRRGALAWRPGLVRLPRLLPARFPAHNVVTAYLAEERADAAGNGTAAPLAPEHVALDVRGDGAPEVLRAVLASGFADNPGVAARLADALAMPRAEYAPEVTSGVALYAHHTPEVARPRLFAGVSRDGLALPQTGGPVHVVLALLVPQELPTEAYLRLVAQAARLARREATVEALCNAASPDEARAALLDARRPDSARSDSARAAEAANVA